jgi:hypothetical protein
MNSDETKTENGNSKNGNAISNIRAWIGDLYRRVLSFDFRFSKADFPFSTFLSRLPWRLVAIGGCLLLALAWVHERDARLRRSLELEQLKSETAARVKELEAQSEEALRAANQRNALVIRELEASRLELAKKGEELRQRLAALERDERVRVERVATLPSQELAERVAARLDADADKGRDSGLGVRDSGGPASPEGPSSPIPGAAMRTSPLQEPALTLDTAAQRKVETAFTELDSCREQSAVKDEQIANCRQQLTSSAAIADRMDDSLRQLNEAIRLKDEILARRETEHGAELKAARGSRWERFRKAVTYVAIGVVAGAVLAK